MIAAILACASLTLTADVDEWYSMTLNGAPAGWSNVTETVEGDLRTTSSVESMTIGRGGVDVTVRASVEWKDTTGGQPISMKWTQEMGGPPATTTWEFLSDHVRVTSHQGGRTTTREQPLPNGVWLTPAATRAVMKATGGTGAAQWRTLIPDLGLQPVAQRLTQVGERMCDVLGRRIAVTVWEVQTEGLPVTMETWFSSDWRPVMTSMKAPFGEIRSTMTDRTTALRDHGAASAEMFTSLFIRPTGSIGRQMEADRAFLRLKTHDGAPLELPASGSQTIAGVSDAGLLLLVERDASLAAASGESADPAYREASMMIDSNDPEVQALAELATTSLGPRATDSAKAEAARATVRRWIQRKGLSTAFASASDTVRAREGDCSEHGVLLAAVLRAEGIPSRVASGLVWMDQVEAFGWHMWTQALIDGAWVDLDATLPVPFTVGHVLVATSSLEDGDGQRELMKLLGLLGNLDVEVVRVDR